MARSLFDPLKTAAAKAVASTPSTDTPLTVTQLAARIDGALKSGFPQSIRFSGEVSGFRDRTHWYFDLKDAGAVVNCVMFQSAARRAGFVPQNGEQVIARGKVEYYAAGGRVSIVLDSLERAGAGALELAYRALCEELRGLGWFSTDRKRPLPSFPRRIGVVTSRSAAALQDVLVTMKRRCPAVGVLLADCRVQGPGAADEVAAAVKYLGLHAAALGIDAILVTRGGGSMEDLWAFNERIVAEAIVHCPIPVVAAIGHETDTTIAELVADERCATPTQAAVRLTPDAPALLREVDSTANRLTYLIEQQLRGATRLLDSIASRPVFASPTGTLAAYSTSLDRCGERLGASMTARQSAAHVWLDRMALRLERCRPAAVHAAREQAMVRLESRLGAAVKHLLASAAAMTEAKHRELAAVSPLRVLERGYSVTTDASGRLIRSTKDAPAGTILRTQVSDGRIESRVEGAAAGDSGCDPATAPAAPILRPAKRPARPAPPGDQPSLF